MPSTLTQTMDSDRDFGTSLAEYHVDPYEIAYLRGGSLEYLKLRLFELMQMGCLIVTNRRLALSPDFQYWSELTPPDQQLLTFFRTPRTSEETLDLEFPQELEDACRQYRQELRQRRMLSGRLVLQGTTYVFVAALVLTCLLALIVAVTTLSQHLLPAAIAAAIAFSVILHYCLGYRITREGKQYLEQLRGQFESLARSDSATRAGAPHQDTTDRRCCFRPRRLGWEPFRRACRNTRCEHQQGVRHQEGWRTR
jgi:uncharacterized protein (TIGR04222 family)